ncbi:hypothetical protein scyTo_0014300 [Scyliorhinus torazame]|uniref:Uncharacterized protein n=1 Tax=Scyliorhinus torazame TaxID=75743 RepID=A0A401NJZ0_SCYTO|nr:hypothetical protein [Scyliorhinus torazame]
MRGVEPLLGSDMSELELTAVNHENAVQQLMDNIQAGLMADAIKVGQKKMDSKAYFDGKVKPVEYEIRNKFRLQIHQPGTFLAPKYHGL